MIFSKTGIDGIPLWFLIWQGRKSITRRPPPCKHCKYKEWEHSENQHICSVSSFTEEEDENGDPYSYTTHYEPDLSKWQPKTHDCDGWQCDTCDNKTCRDCGGVMDNDGNTACAECQEREGLEPAMGRKQKQRIDALKEIAVQPTSCTCAICKNCGGWREMHIKDDFIASEEIHIMFLEGEKIAFHFKDEPITTKHVVCNNYSPLKVRIKSVMMESEWRSEIEKAADKVAAVNTPHARQVYIEKAEENDAFYEGFSSWEKLQEALSIYPKGTKLARIEFGRD